MSTELKVQNKFINSLLPSPSPTKTQCQWELQKSHELFQEWMFNIQIFVPNFCTRACKYFAILAPHRDGLTLVWMQWLYEYTLHPLYILLITTLGLHSWRDSVWIMKQTVLFVIYNKQICKKSTITLLFIILNIYLVINLSMVYLTRFSVTQAYKILNGKMIRKKRNRRECGRKWPWPNLAY